jgi:type III secretion system (T3SS) protein HpaP
MSSDSGLSLPTAFNSDSLARGSGERMRPSDRDVAVFERALRGENRKVTERQNESSGDAEQDLSRKRLQAQTDVAAILNAPNPQAASAVAAPAAPQAPMPLDDLIAQYVQMLAVSDPGKIGDPRMMLKLDPSLLPQTELYLTRAPEGWVLQANTRSPEAYRVLNDFGPALERRFAMRGLGSLQIQTTMQPSAIQGIV